MKKPTPKTAASVKPGKNMPMNPGAMNKGGVRTPGKGLFNKG